MVLRTTLCLLTTLLLVGCDSANERSPSTVAATPAPAARPAPAAGVAGTYRVAGTTTERGGDVSRRIEGTIVLTQDGDAYRASFQLSTLYPTPEGNHQAAVIGKGEGKVRGSELEGSAHTQIVVASVPGVDTDFAFAPRAVTARIESTSKASIAPDGKLVIEIDNVPASGDRYRPTHTKLTGERAELASARPQGE